MPDIGFKLFIKSDILFLFMCVDTHKNIRHDNEIDIYLYIVIGVCLAFYVL